MKCIYCGVKFFSDLINDSCEDCEKVIGDERIQFYEDEEDDFSGLLNPCGRIQPVMYDDGYDDPKNW